MYDDGDDDDDDDENENGDNNECLNGNLKKNLQKAQIKVISYETGSERSAAIYNVNFLYKF